MLAKPSLLFVQVKGGTLNPKSIATIFVMKVLRLLTEHLVAGFLRFFSPAFLMLLRSLIIACGLEKVLTMDSINSQNFLLLVIIKI